MNTRIFSKLLGSLKLRRMSRGTKIHPLRPRRLIAEQLELRQLMATRIWDGGAVANDRWTDEKNWTGNVAPVAGDDLVFPNGVVITDRGTNNDFPTDTAFRNITFERGDYKVTGNRFKLTGDLTHAGNGRLDIKCDIKIAGGNHIIDAFGTSAADPSRIVLDNAIIGDGTSGQLTYRSSAGHGRIELKGNRPNTYSNSIRADGPQLLLIKADNVRSISGPLTLVGSSGTVVKVFDNITSDRHALGQFAPGIDVSLSGTKPSSGAGLSVSAETIHNLSLNGSLLFIEPKNSSNDPEDNGRLIIQGKVTSSGGNLISGEELQISSPTASREFEVQDGVLNITSSILGGTLKKSGVGLLVLQPSDASNSFAALSVLTGEVEARNGSDGFISLPKSIGVGNLGNNGIAQLTLNATREVIPDNGNVSIGTFGKFVANGVAIETFNRLEVNGGEVTVFRSHLKLLDRLDLDAADMFVQSQGDLEVLGNSIVEDSDVEIVLESDIDIGNNLTLRQSEFFGDATSSLLLGNRLQVNVPTSDQRSTIHANLFLKKGSHEFRVLDGSPGIDLLIDGSINNLDGIDANAAHIVKTGAGTMRLLGTHANTGATSIGEGVFIDDATSSTSSVLVNNGARAFGTGVAKTLGLNSGGTFRSVRPQTESFEANTLFLAFQSIFSPRLNGINQFDSVKTETLIIDRFLVNGVAEFPVLNVVRNFSVPLGTSFKIIDVTGSTPNNPETLFQNQAGVPIPDGGGFLIQNQRFTIDYDGGDGNDIVITRNDPPAFANRQLTASISEGEVATLSGHITEPNPNDTFFLEVDWGDGTQKTYRFLPGTPRDIAVTHRYLDDPQSADDRYAVHVRWRDQYDGANATDLEIRVLNAAPQLSNIHALVSNAINPSGLVTVEGRIKDQGRQDRLTLLIQWKSGGRFEQFDYPAGQSTIAHQHRYTSPGRYTITVLLVDDEGLSTSQSLTVDIV